MNCSMIKNIVVFFMEGYQSVEVDESGLLGYAYQHPLLLLALITLIFCLISIALRVNTNMRAKRKNGPREREKNYRMMAEAFGQAGLEYDFAKDKLIVFGENHEEVDIPEVVERFHEKLKRRVLRMTLTEAEFDEMCENAEPGKTYQIEFQCGMKGKGWNWFNMIFVIIFTKDENPRPARLIGCLIDSQKQHQTQERLVELGQYDKLTRTYNRAGAEQQIEEALENLEEYSQNVFLLMDVDKFKQINDSLGHLCGDDVLRAIGRHVNEIFQGDTIICRWGGDEFTMFVRGPGAEAELLRKRLEELQRRMKEYEYEGMSYPIGLSIGGVRPVQGMTLEELFGQADEVLYKVKKRGRDGFLIQEA